MAEIFTRAPKSLWHTAGTVPERPLLVGDLVTMPDGVTRAVVRAFTSLLVLDGMSGPVHRGPVEGDFSKTITAITKEA